MIWRIEITHKKGVFDSAAESIHHDMVDLGLKSVRHVTTALVYYLEGQLTQKQVEHIASGLLIDPVSQDYHILSNRYPALKTSNNQHVIEIAYNKGVMDPVEESTMKGIHDFGIQSVTSVRTAKRYNIQGDLSSRDLDLIVNKVLANKLIQHVVDYKKPLQPLGLSEKDPQFQLKTIELIQADEKQLKQISQAGQLFLNLNEMKAIQKHFRGIGRNPTDCELETIAQTWSEHCYHKTFRGNITYTFEDKGKKKTKVIKNLLKSTIVKATHEINKPWCVSVFHDNAGVIKFDQQDNICFKVETHNHPSALEPFGGANTGIGGVLRDILGTGLGAKPFCNTDVFCFAPPDTPFEKLPSGTLHPRRIMKGVVSGVRDYGNKMGIPTVNGSILFDPKFVGNPLVYCGSVGIMPKNKVFKKVHTGDLIVVAGGKTGRDGIHGATFSSGELTEDSEVVSSGAVQIGDPIQEKKVLDAMLKARDQNLYTAVTDCGAGGLSSAVGEMGENVGAKVDLDKVPLKYHGLTYTEVWISESQERMVFSVPKKNIKKLLKIFEGEHVEATVIGQFTGSKTLELFFNGINVCTLDMPFLHAGPPKISKIAHWKTPRHKTPKRLHKSNLTGHLHKVLGHYNVCSKEWVVRQYDHEVQGGSIVKPFVGVACDGPSDASVVTPKLGSYKGVAVSNGINVRFGMIDPFHMATSCIDEAIRQIVSVGGDVDKIAILDNFCWGNPDKPDRLGGLVRAAQGCYEAAVGYKVPFISGKDSLYNEFTVGQKSIAIPGTILISAIGIIEDVRQCVTMDLKRPGNLLYIVGETKDECGGSIYYDTLGAVGNEVPKVNFSSGMKIFKALHHAVKKGLVQSMHDCSEGGLAVTLAEMAFSGNLGIDVFLDHVPFQGKKKTEEALLFSETNSRFIVEIQPEDKPKFDKLLQGVSHGVLGVVLPSQNLTIFGLDQNICIDAGIMDLKNSWQKTLAFK
ncbi:MAG: phosphoribosylformylglycinamidine synthase subunit PurL [Candidatus Omnitrophica bacterium]|nr:phosphoribosylformylglycinamidine synthase subunit PurL [Candidatus Omnitrophota bacterium]